MESTYPSTEHKHRDSIIVDNLYWAVCGTIDGMSECFVCFPIIMNFSDSKLLPRLVVARSNGSLTIFTIEMKPNGWEIDQSRALRQVHSFLRKAILLTVVDAKTGVECSATPARLALMLAGSDSETVDITGLDTYFIVAGHKEMRCLLGVAGEKVSKVGFTSDGMPMDIKLLRSHRTFEAWLFPLLTILTCL